MLYACDRIYRCVCINIICLKYFDCLWKPGESSWNTMEIVLAVLFGYRLPPPPPFTSTAEMGSNQGFRRSIDLCAYGWEDSALTLFPTASFLSPHDNCMAEEKDRKNLAFELRIAEDIPEDEGSTGSLINFSLVLFLH